MNDQRLLTRLRLESFKSIAQLDQELGQLTVLVGENSAGKSSLLQSIVMMSQIARSDVVGGDVPLYGADVDIGSFKDALHSGKAADEITVGLTMRDLPPDTSSMATGLPTATAEFEWRVSLGPPVVRHGGASIRRLALRSSVTKDQIVASLVDPASGDSGEASRASELQSLLARSIVLARVANDLSLELAARTAFNDTSSTMFSGAWRADSNTDESGMSRTELQLAYVEVTGGLPDLALRARSNRRTAAEVFLTLSDPDFVLERDSQMTLLEVKPRVRSDVSETLFDEALVDEFADWLRQLDDALRDRGSIAIPSPSFRVDAELLGDASYEAVLQSLEDAQLPDVVDRDQLVRAPLEVIDSAGLVRDALSRRLHLLGPLRDDPSPTFRPGVVGSGITPLGKEGQYTVAFLDEHGGEQILCPLLPDADHLDQPTSDVRPLTSAVDYWLARLGIAERTRLEHVGRMLEFDIIDPQTKLRRDLTSVGVGASQILPVIVLCLAAKPGDLILLEQPELHLHPKPQQVLGDFLLGIAQTGRQLLVETHSEYFVNRLRLRMVEQRLDEHPESLKLLYAIRDRWATKFEELRPNALGAFDEWPEGFFDQSPQESEQIVRAAGCTASRRSECSLVRNLEIVLTPSDAGVLEVCEERDVPAHRERRSDVAQSGTMTSGTVVVSDDALLISDLLETDRDVVDFVAGSEDPVDATRRCLRIGVRAIRAASATLDSETVSTRFDALHDGLASCLTEAVDQIAAAAGGLLDEEHGALTNTLALHRKQLGDLLDNQFDPQSKVSVMGKIEELVAVSLARQTDGIKRIVSLDSSDGPLQVLKTEILAGFSGPVADLAVQLRELSEKVAVNRAVAPVVEITTAKGFAFEEVLHARLSALAAHHGNTPEMTGGVTGLAGTKKGDAVVNLNTEDTLGIERRFVLEAKARRLNARQTHDELDAALDNRGALAAIVVFDHQSKAPSAVPFHYSGNKAIVVLDDDAAALRLVYMWARWVVRREGQQDDGDSIDHDRIVQLIASGKRAIERHSAIKRSHSQVRNCIEQAASQVASMVSEIETTLTEIEAELSAAEIGEDV